MNRLKMDQRSNSISKKDPALQKWLKTKAASRYATWWLGLFSFSDSSFSPIPPDPVLATLSYVNQKKWLHYAAIATVTSLLGGLFGYALGIWFQIPVLSLFENHLGLAQEIDNVAQMYRDNAAWSIFVAAFTPIPFKVFTVSAGIFEISLLLFLTVSAVGRFLRFAAVSYVSARFGHYGLARFRSTLLWLTIVIVAVYIMLQIQ